LNENISSEQYEAEIQALNKKLRLAENKIMESAYTDPKNPFDNPTEFRHYNSDYRKIAPEIKKPFHKLPLEPDYGERQNIKRFYNITGIQIIFHIIASNLIMYLLSMAVIAFMILINPETDRSFISNYFYSTAFAPINMLVFMICNVFFGFLGLKMTKTSPGKLIQTQDFTFLKAVAYLFIAFFIQYYSSIIAEWINIIMTQCGLKMYNINDYTDFQSIPSKSSEFIYSLIIAPITEELFYRGMVLKNLSKASQRCGIFISALLFGLMHATIPQIILGFAMGIFLAHITIKHNSIIPAILVHIFNNSLVYIMSPLDNISSDAGIIIVNAIYYIMVMFGLFALVRFKLTNKLPHDTPQQSRRGISLVLHSVPILLVIIYYISMTISYILRIS